MMMETIRSFVLDPVVYNVTGMLSALVSCLTLVVVVAVFRKQDSKAAQIRDLQFITAHRKTISDLLEPMVAPERKHMFHGAEVMAAFEQGAFCFNHGIVGQWARMSFHDEFSALVKIALADETIMLFLKQNDDKLMPYNELLGFMKANKHLFAGELRAILSYREPPLRLGGPKFLLSLWRTHGPGSPASGRPAARSKRAARRMRKAEADEARREKADGGQRA